MSKAIWQCRPEAEKISCKVNVISLGEVYVFVCKGNEIEKLGFDVCVCVVDEIIQL